MFRLPVCLRAAEGWRLVAVREKYIADAIAGSNDEPVADPVCQRATHSERITES